MALLSRLNDTDLKLLRVFLSVVAYGGFTPAQMQLNVSAASVSGQMAELERRLGAKLCERGRAGFRLTEVGAAVQVAAERLLGAHETFRSEVAAIKGKMIGRLRFGIVDNTASNPASRISVALAGFADAAPDVHVAITIDEPNSLEAALLDGRLDAVVAALHHRVPGLAYVPLFPEGQGLYCGCDHALFRGVGPNVDDVASQRFVARGYMGQRDAPQNLPAAATGYSMEAIALLILSGRYVGYLPMHYANGWVIAGAMRELLPDNFRSVSTFHVAYRRSRLRDPVTQRFLACLKQAHAVAAPAALRPRARRTAPGAAPDGLRA